MRFGFPSFTPLLLATALLAGCASTPPGPSEPPAQAASRADLDALRAAVDASQRGSVNRARDIHRHPVETLAFFGVAPTDTVVEISPGAGWYSEILAPYLRDRGQLVLAIAASPLDNPGRTRIAPLQVRFTNVPDHFGKPRWVEYEGQAPVLGEPASADVVLTFRNVHNWVAAGTADAYFKAFFDVLKPGGVLGVVDHRAKPGTDIEAMKKSGYLTEALVVELAGRAGFVLEARSEVNANPKDGADHPNGVWTLPPTNRHAPTEAEHYRGIGESDRMTLRFRKPA